MVCGMARSVEHAELLRAKSQHGAVIDSDHLVFRNCSDCSPQVVHLIAVNSGRACDQSGRVDEVRPTLWVDIDLGSKLFRPAPGAAGVIQMNVRSQEVANMLGLESEFPDPLYHGIKDGFRTTVHDN
jgi:hypothetical protein